MKLRVAALALGAVTGFIFSWARMTDPRTFHAMLSLESPRIYLLMGSAVPGAVVGPRLLRGRRALLTGEPRVLFGIGWGISEACPGPTAAALGAGRVLALAVAAGVLAGVKLQPSLARAAERAAEGTERIPVVQGADVL